MHICACTCATDVARSRCAAADVKEAKKAFRELRDEDVYPVLGERVHWRVVDCRDAAPAMRASLAARPLPPLADARNSGNAAYLKSWVAECSIAYKNGE